MRIDFINDGSHDAPIIRLFSDQKNDIESLLSSLLKLSTSELNEVTLSDLPHFISRIKLNARLSKIDEGIKISKDRKEFNVEMSNESWRKMTEKLGPFIIDQTGFTWLYESKTIFMLFTTDGYW
jgi:hypothetical protein